jgi:hypothetical protein
MEQDPFAADPFREQCRVLVLGGEDDPEALDGAKVVRRCEEDGRPAGP